MLVTWTDTCQSLFAFKRSNFIFKMHTNSPATKTLLRFGLVADLQYANIDDAYNWNKTKKRYYRSAIDLLGKAMKDWKQNDAKFILQLGDLVDGFCKRTEEPIDCLNRILDIFDQEQWPVLNVVGNHELYNFEKDTLYKSRLFKNQPASNRAYYTFSPYQGLKVCVLNTYEISVLGELEGTASYDVAHSFLTERNPNKDKNDPSGLESVDRRFVRFNGAVSKEQLEWLSKELILATKQKENVLVVGHNPIYLPATDSACLCWNYSEILDILSENSVVCYISGHDHDGGYSVDQSGIHHITMPGAIEHPDSYAVGYLLEDSLVIHGRGDMFEVNCPLRFKL
ncbi:manganese-dependent ADP-ribose/CDP-alcohol diphosphatase-like [Mytilus edulis]|uniref:manganese-dependent ADP-ribose/CDP-alcohol diphosphatase-like n=1 Tax=Mytilus edulis TaxID=6550 RepID=UPI0039F0BA1B